MRGQRYLQEVIINGVTKKYYPKSEEQMLKNKAYCEEQGYPCTTKKLYPFNMMKNQHNFDLIANICFNEMADMESGEIEWDDKRYNELEERRIKAEEFFCMPLPIAWVDGKTYGEMKEMAAAAVHHRQETCIKNGRPDLVDLC